MYCSSVVEYNESFAKPNWEYTNITRPFSIIYYIYGGKGYYTFNGETHQFKKNHLYILPANTPFSLFQDKDDNLKHMFIHAFIHPELKTLLSYDTSKDKFLLRLMQFMKMYIYKRNTIYIRKLMEMLISYVSEIRSDESKDLHVSLKNYIDSNFLTVFKTNDLSSAFNYSNSHLVKIFKQAYNLTPKQYSHQLTLKHVLHLLDNNYSVSQISSMLDFSSPENFSRFFRNNYGCSPSEYVKRFQVKQN